MKQDRRQPRSMVVVCTSPPATVRLRSRTRSRSRRLPARRLPSPRWRRRANRPWMRPLPDQRGEAERAVAPRAHERLSRVARSVGDAAAVRALAWPRACPAACSPLATHRPPSSKPASRSKTSVACASIRYRSPSRSARTPSAARADGDGAALRRSNAPVHRGRDRSSPVACHPRRLARAGTSTRGLLRAKASPGAIAAAIGVQLRAAAAGILARYPPGYRQHVVAIAAR